VTAFPTIQGIAAYAPAVSALDKLERASEFLDKSIDALSHRGSTEDAARFAKIAHGCDSLADDLRFALTEIEAEASKETA